MQLSTDIRNARLDIIETLVGVSPTMKIFDGSEPTNISDADAGTVLATIALPSDWMLAAAAGLKEKSGAWEDPVADAPGNARYFRVYTSGNVCKLQGSISLPGGGGDMTINNIAVSANQDIKIIYFAFLDGNGAGA